MNTLRTGVIGVGYLGQFHAEKYSRNPRAVLAGIVDADRARASLVADKVRTLLFSSVEEIIGKVDALSIVVPTVHHYRVAKQCLEQGIHLLVEKPVTETLEQADELVHLAERRGLVLQVGHIERFNPAIRAVKEQLRSPRYLQAERSAPFTTRCTDVNVVLDLMIHDLDIVCDLAGSEPVSVSAAGASVITREIDAVTARIMFRNGCVADVSASRVSDEKKRVLRVFEEGMVYSADYQSQTASVSRRKDAGTPELVTAALPAERRDTLYDEIDDFLACVQEKKRPQASGAEGRRALALARLITDSIENRQPGFLPVP